MDLQAISSEMMAAQDEARSIPTFTSRVPGFDNDAAYRVAVQVHEEKLRRGLVPVGRKIGFTNPGMWDRYGVREPIWGHVYDRTVVMPRGAPFRCSLGAFVEPMIEPEIVLHFRAPPPHGAGAAQVLASIDWIAHGFEIVQSHFPGWNFRAPDTIADGSLHARLYVGEPREPGRLGGDLLERLAAFSITLSCDGTERARGQGANVLGSPIQAAGHILAVIARQPEASPVRAGELITTGTITPAFPVRPGETWTTAIDGIDLPGMTITFDP
jgi:2-keto-4-pentenoate hydratase